MKVTVKLFAAARELAGVDALVIEAPDGATAAEVRAALVQTEPRLASLAGASLLAVNTEYAGEATRVCEGDEIALIPPVSGG